MAMGLYCVVRGDFGNYCYGKFEYVVAAAVEDMVEEDDGRQAAVSVKPVCLV